MDQRGQASGENPPPFGEADPPLRRRGTVPSQGEQQAWGQPDPGHGPVPGPAGYGPPMAYVPLAPPKKKTSKLGLGCLGLVVLVIAIGAGAVIANSGKTSGVTTTPVAGSSGVSSAAPAASKAGVGSAIDLPGENAGDDVQVTVVKVVDPDRATDGISTPTSGTRYVSVQFLIVNTGKNPYQDDPYNDVTAKDAAGDAFQPDLMVSSTAAGAQLDSTTNLAPGDKALGYATFDVPNGDNVTQVQYALNGGMFGNSGEWTVG